MFSSQIESTFNSTGFQTIYVYFTKLPWLEISVVCKARRTNRNLPRVGYQIQNHQNAEDLLFELGDFLSVEQLSIQHLVDWALYAFLVFSLFLTFVALLTISFSKVSPGLVLLRSFLSAAHWPMRGSISGTLQKIWTRLKTGGTHKL